MAGQYGVYPILGVPVYASVAAFPATASNGSLAIDGSTDTLYIYSTTAMAWEAIGGTAVPLGVGTYDSQTPQANGLDIANNLIYAQSATASVPGMVNTGSQTLAGNKTFTGSISASNLSGTNTGDVTLGTANGLSLTSQVLSLGLSSTSTTGALSSTDWNTFNGKQAAGSYITALTGDGTASGPGSAALTLATVNTNVGSFGSASSVAGFTVNGKGLITAASSTSIQIAESQVTNLVSDLAGKQPTGNYITALTGDVTASGPGSVAATLATVNSNIGSFTYSNITVNGKGLVTAASSGAAPVTTLSAVGASPNANAATITGNTLNLQPFSGAQPGVVTASGGGTTNFLRADGTWASPPGTGSGNFGAALFSGGFQNGTGSVYFYQQSPSQADWIATIPGPTLTTNFSNGFGTVVGASGDLPGITIPSVPATGVLRITATSSAMYVNSSTSVYLTDGSGTFINAASMRENVSNDPAPFTIVGYYSVTASTGYTFKLQGSVASGTTFLGGTGGDPYILDFSVEYVA